MKYDTVAMFTCAVFIWTVGLIGYFIVQAVRAEWKARKKRGDG